MIVAYYRGYVTQQHKKKGGMAAIGLGSNDALKFLTDGVVVACENSPSSSTISGDLDPLNKVIETVKAQKPDVLARQLKVDMAYHSRKYCVGRVVDTADMVFPGPHRSYDLSG